MGRREGGVLVDLCVAEKAWLRVEGGRAKRGLAVWSNLSFLPLFHQTMKTSALRFLGFSLISIFCGTAAAYDANAKLEEIKTPQAAMPAEADQGSPYAKDVERLVKQRNSEAAQAIAPIQRRFDLAAQQLLRKAIQAGNLDAANKIKAAIENPPDLATLREEAQSPLDKEFLRLAEQREKDSAIAVAPAQTTPPKSPMIPRARPSQGRPRPRETP